MRPSDLSSVAALGPGRGAQSPLFCFRPPGFVATHDFFAKITQISDVFVFPKFEKVGTFAASIERPKAKNVSASRGLCLLPTP